MAARPSLNQKHVESFNRLGIEVEIDSPHGTVWLVPRKTNASRTEITADDILRLAGTARMFRARVVGLSPLPAAEPQQAQLFA